MFNAILFRTLLENARLVSEREALQMLKEETGAGVKTISETARINYAIASVEERTLAKVIKALDLTMSFPGSADFED